MESDVSTFVTVIVLAVLLASMLAVVFLSRGAWRGRGKVTAFGASRQEHNTGVLWALILLAIVYAGLLGLVPSLTGIPRLDGGIGVALGLYICAHPAANAINLLFLERYALSRIRSEASTLRWLALNLLVLLAGWWVIFVGLIRLVDRRG